MNEGNNLSQVNNKKDTIKVVLIVILTILLIASLSFIAYDKLIKKDEVSSDSNTEENNNQNNQISDSIVGVYKSEEFDINVPLASSEDMGYEQRKVSNYIVFYEDGTFIMEDNEMYRDVYLVHKGKYSLYDKNIRMYDFIIYVAYLDGGFYDMNTMLGTSTPEELENLKLDLPFENNEFKINNHTYKKISSDTNNAKGIEGTVIADGIPKY